MPDRVPYTVVDLFCGCGGLSRGLERTGRFRTVLGVDNNATALATFAANHGREDARPATWLGDIRDLERSSLWDMVKLAGISGRGDLDLLVGGPPCEGFSRNKVYTDREMVSHEAADPRAGREIKYLEEKYWSSAWTGAAKPAARRMRAYNPFLSDPRNFLFREFLRIADDLRPKVVIIENVRQMLEHAEGAVGREILSWFEENGYHAEARVLNAAEFGVPQQRHRAFILAVDSKCLDMPLPWPVPSHSQGEYLTVKDAIADLPPAIARTKVNLIERAPKEAYSLPQDNAFREFVRSHTAGPANNIFRTPSEQVLQRIRAMKPGMRPHELPKELQTKKYYYNSYGRLAWDKPANTITKSFLYPGSGRFCHPEQDRVISYREAARLQSFDDDFIFYATSQESLAHMIGGAVPPLLGYRFGAQVAGLLDDFNGSVELVRSRKSA